MMLTHAPEPNTDAGRRSATPARPSVMRPVAFRIHCRKRWLRSPAMLSSADNSSSASVEANDTDEVLRAKARIHLAKTLTGAARQKAEEAWERTALALDGSIFAQEAHKTGRAVFIGRTVSHELAKISSERKEELLAIIYERFHQRRALLRSARVSLSPSQAKPALHIRWLTLAGSQLVEGVVVHSQPISLEDAQAAFHQCRREQPHDLRWAFLDASLDTPELRAAIRHEALSYMASGLRTLAGDVSPAGSAHLVEGGNEAP